MGLGGKTLQAITLLWTVMTQGVFFSVFTKCRKVFVWLPIIVSGSFVSGSPIIGLTGLRGFCQRGIIRVLCRQDSRQRNVPIQVKKSMYPERDLWSR